MMKRDLSDLVLDLKQRSVMGEPPPVLLLGAGASRDSGIGAMEELYQFMGCKSCDEFLPVIQSLTAAERYRLLADFLQNRDPLNVTPGYHALALLIKKAYFDLILTLNLDPLLEDALVAADMRRKHYLLIVNGAIRLDRMKLLLGAASPRVKVLKLHGDLFHRLMAWTPQEMDTYIEEIGEDLETLLKGRDLLLVGVSLRDERIRGLVLRAINEGQVVWCAEPYKVPECLTDKATVRLLGGPQAKAKALFQQLAEALVPMSTTAAPATPPSGTGKPEFAVPQPQAGAEMNMVPASEAIGKALRQWLAPSEAVRAAASAAPAIDDLMQSVVAVGPGGGPGSCTGFLLDEPRCIVADGYAIGVLGSRQLEVVPRSGTHFTTKVLFRNSKHPFGPAVLAVPEGLHIPPLKLNRAAVSVGTAVTVAVATGNRVGISSGAVCSRAENVKIEPVGLANGLSRLDCAVAPGACGGPVVDESLCVCGFIVAGSSDLSQPVSYMYPASLWAGILAEALRRKSPRRRAAAHRHRP